MQRLQQKIFEIEYIDPVEEYQRLNFAKWFEAGMPLLINLLSKAEIIFLEFGQALPKEKIRSVQELAT